MKYIKINNIDLAAYLQLKNYQLVKTVYHSPIDSDYYFENSKNVQEHIKKFNTGTAQVNVIHFLYNRTLLKQITKKIGIRKGRIKPKYNDVVLTANSFKPKENQTFFYIDTDNKINYGSFEKNNTAHKSLVENGNVFQTSQEAVKARAKI